MLQHIFNKFSQTMKHFFSGLMLVTTLLVMAFTSANNGYEPGMEAADFNLKNIDCIKFLESFRYKKCLTLFT